MQPRVTAAVSMGGALGAALRWGIVEASDSSSSWPTGVFVANILGCAVLGFVIGRYAEFATTSAFVGVTVGFCGALTTFSAFAIDLAVFLDEADWLLFAAYLTSSAVAGWAVFVGGRSLGLARYTATVR